MVISVIAFCSLSPFDLLHAAFSIIWSCMVCWLLLLWGTVVCYDTNFLLWCSTVIEHGHWALEALAMIAPCVCECDMWLQNRSYWFLEQEIDRSPDFYSSVERPGDIVTNQSHTVSSQWCPCGLAEIARSVRLFYSIVGQHVWRLVIHNSSSVRYHKVKESIVDLDPVIVLSHSFVVWQKTIAVRQRPLSMWLAVCCALCAVHCVVW